MLENKTSAHPVHVLSVGFFGRAVAAYLRSMLPEAIETTVLDNEVPVPEKWPTARVNVLALWRAQPPLCELVEQVSFQNSLPFIPVMPDLTVLRIGPIVLPGDACCWTCWAKRWKQHSDWPEARAALLAHYAARPEAGPQGYLEPFALAAAARVARLIDEIDSGTARGGSIWQIDMMTREMTTSMAIGFHNCPRCGLHRNGAQRSYAELQEDLAYLWTANPREAESS